MILENHNIMKLKPCFEFFSVTPPSCQGIINRAKGGVASASTQLATSHSASMAFDGNKILVHNGSEQPDILESYGSLSHELRSEYRSKQIKAAERAK